MGRREAKQKGGRPTGRLLVCVNSSCLDQGGDSKDEKKWTKFTYVLEETSKGFPNRLNGVGGRRESGEENNLGA